MDNKLSTSKEVFEKVSKTLIDPLAINLAKSIKWIYLNEISKTSEELYPVAVLGKGRPIFLLHGFDSCFMEFRRLAPYLENEYKIIIPDLFGFGFCPRPKNVNYNKNAIIIVCKFTS